MNKDILFIIAIFILVILGVYLVFINGGLSRNPTFNILNSIKTETQINFSNIEEEKFIYKFESSDQRDITGMGFGVLNITNEAAEAVRKYFSDQGFRMDYFEMSSDLAGTSYYSKEKEVCVIKMSVLISETGLPEATDKLSISIFCGELVR